MDWVSPQGANGRCLGVSRSRHDQGHSSDYRIARHLAVVEEDA